MAMMYQKNITYSYHMDPLTLVSIMGPYARVLVTTVMSIPLWSYVCTLIKVSHHGVGLVQLETIESCCCCARVFPDKLALASHII